MKTRLIPIAVLCICAFFTVLNAQGQDVLTASQWQKDLRFLQTTVHKDHPFLFKKVTAEAFDTSVEELYNEIPNLEDHEIPVSFSRIVSLFEYGHTQIPFSTVAKRGVLPVNLYHFNDGVFIEGTTKAHQKILGAKVLKVGGKSIEKVMELVRPVVPVENDQYFKAYGLRFVTVPDVLHSQKVISKISDKVSVTLQKNGKTFEYVLPKIELEKMSRDYSLTVPNESWISARDTSETPLYLKDLHEKYYYFEFLPDTKTLYVRQSSVFNHESESLKDFYNRLFEFIDTHTIDKLIYDVRLNGGGNNYNNLPLIKGLMARPNINQKGKFFYIIGRRTFSACQNLTNEIGRYTEAIMVGEPTSENINFYGDSKKVTLPNSKINAYLSFAWWQDLPAWENRDATVPSIAVDMSFEEYKTNQDPVLATALNYTTKSDEIFDPFEHLRNLFIEGKFEQVQSDAAKFVKDPKYKYYDFENEFIKTAAHVMKGGNLQAGYFILGMVIKLYPESANALYHFGDVQQKMNNLEGAKEAYDKVIALNTDASLTKSAQERLKELDKK
ncbi:tol-pal system YbgF family protein [Aquimarina sp. SS2-1]|uniref:tetratricopeptide repeat protein n=1 Tax=Aquimarina besae TaxID=3342247 RepID=UPI00366CECB2